MGFKELPSTKILIHGARRINPEIDWNIFKPPVIPEGFVLVIDSREQFPLFVDWQMKKNEIRTQGNLIIKGKTLKDGDYSVAGYEKQVAIERKQQSDFESYIQKEYQIKTIKKLERLSKLYFAGLIIQANIGDLYEYPISPAMTREKVRNHLVSFHTHYHVHTHVSENRKELEIWVLDHLIRCYRYLHEGVLFDNKINEVTNNFNGENIEGK